MVSVKFLLFSFVAALVSAETTAQESSLVSVSPAVSGISSTVSGYATTLAPSTPASAASSAISPPPVLPGVNAAPTRSAGLAVLVGAVGVIMAAVVV